MKNSFIISFFSGLLIIFLMACTSEIPSEEKLVEITLHPNMMSEKFNDQYFFSHEIGYLSSNDQYICIPDKHFGAFFIMDLQLDPVFRIGERGKGPEDFIHPFLSGFHNNGLNLYDAGNLKITHVNLDQFHIKRTRQVQEPKFHLGRFIIEPEGTVLFSDFKQSAPFHKHSSNGQHLSSFGAFFDHQDEKHKRAENMFHLVANDMGEIFAISFDKPIIKKFSPEGQEIYEADLSYLFDFHIDLKNRIISDNPNLKNTTWNLFRDAVLAEDTLYLLYWSEEEFQQFYPNVRQTSFQVLSLKDTDLQLKPQAIYDLNLSEGRTDDLRMFSTITVQGDQLYAFDKRSQTLYRYLLP